MVRKKEYVEILNEIRDLVEDEKSIDAVDHLLEKIESKFEATHSSSTDEDDLLSDQSHEFSLPAVSQANDKTFWLFSDGACRGNPGPGSWACMGQDKTGDVLFEASGIEKDSTNNRMELVGATEAIRELQKLLEKQKMSLSDSDLHIYLFSDSKYVVDGITRWIVSWKNRGWRKKDNKPPENVELWKELDHFKSQCQNLFFHWVKGHNGHPQNEHCDLLANKALDEAGY